MYVIPLKLPAGYQNDHQLNDLGITPSEDVPVASWIGAKSLESLSQSVSSGTVWRFQSGLMGNNAEVKKEVGDSEILTYWYSTFEVYRLAYGLFATEQEQIDNGVNEDGPSGYVHQHKTIRFDENDTVIYKPNENLTDTFKERYKIGSGTEIDADWRVLDEASQLYIESLIPKEYGRPLYCYKFRTGYYFRVIKRSVYEDPATGTTGGDPEDPPAGGGDPEDPPAGGGDPEDPSAGGSGSTEDDGQTGGGSPEGLSGGAIAGIVLAVLAVFGFVIGLVLYKLGVFNRFFNKEGENSGQGPTNDR